MMNISNNAVDTLNKILPGLAKEKKGWRGLWLQLSQLNDTTARGHAIELAQETLASELRDYHGRIFSCPDGDIIVLGLGIRKSELDSVIHLLNNDLNAEFDGHFINHCRVWNVATHWSEIIKCVTHKLSFVLSSEFESLKQEHAELRSGLVPALTLGNHDSDVMELAYLRRRVRQEKVVLVMEGDAINQRMMEHTIREAMGEGCRLVFANNALQAYQVYALHAPDMVVLNAAQHVSENTLVLAQLRQLDDELYALMINKEGVDIGKNSVLSENIRGVIRFPFDASEIERHLPLCDE